jgi:F-type H+-transporting ATPase subunit gamma
MERLGARPGKINRIWAVGEHIQALVADSGLTQANLLPVPTSIYGITALVGRVLIEVEAAREKGQVVEVHLFHNRPGSGASYEPVGKLLLPLDHAWQAKLTSLPWPTKNPPQVIEGATAALQAFIQGYLFVLLFQACAESLASENASRLAAMQRAEKNIGDILEDLNRTFHRIRQETIDEELFDVVSGYEALSGEKAKAGPARRPAAI